MVRRRVGWRKHEGVGRKVGESGNGEILVRVRDWSMERRKGKEGG